jgi:predicted secreted hydrolase
MRTHLATAAAALALALVMGGCGEGGGETQGNDLAFLAQADGAYEDAVRGRALEFPRDHGAHPGFRIEWWYLTANLEDASGRDYGAQWTLFRTAARPPGSEQGNAWQSGQIYMAHFALTWPAGHRSWQRYARGGDHGGVSQAGARAEPFAAWLDDWSLASTETAWLPLAAQARQDDFALWLELDSDLPPVLQGDAGFSQKHPGGGGSYYYSQPFLQARGEVEIAGKRIPVTGQAWLDREWSSQFLQADQVGWDWFAMHLESGEKLMLFRLRPREGETGGAYRHGVLINPEGLTRTLDADRIGLEAVTESRVAGRLLPTRWRVDLPEIGRRFRVEALREDQWMDVDFPYWDGAVRVVGEGPQNRGRGYLEMTGYAPD